MINPSFHNSIRIEEIIEILVEGKDTLTKDEKFKLNQELNMHQRQVDRYQQMIDQGIKF